MSVRGACGTNFQKLTQGIKATVSQKHLDDEWLSIIEVAFLLRYSDHSTLHQHLRHGIVRRTVSSGEKSRFGKEYKIELDRDIIVLLLELTHREIHQKI